MLDYFEILKRKPVFLDVLDQELRIAEEMRPIENSSATTIQRFFRGASCRTKITKKHYAAGEVQRVFRGHMGRLHTKSLAKQKSIKRKNAFVHYLCIQLQKCFRGYHSRKYKHNQARRKEYCRNISETGRLTLEQMQRYADEQFERESEEARRKRDDDFNKLAGNLHHLVSTRHIRGIYNPHLELIEAPTMNQLPIEEHIRGAVKDLLRTRGITKKGLVADINGTLKIPFKGLKYRLSLQASAPYDTIKKEEARTKLLHKILTRDKGDFLAGGKTALIDKSPAPMAVGEPYMDPWANPMLVKGVPENQKQLLESARTQKPLFIKSFEKPFVSKVGGNRSSTLANDIFDVIAEAEESGGAIHRHLGTQTTRFGLPESVDARSSLRFESDIIPKPPMKTSTTIKSTQKKIKTLDLMTIKAKNRMKINSLKGEDDSLAESSGSRLNEFSSDSEEDEEEMTSQSFSISQMP